MKLFSFALPKTGRQTNKQIISKQNDDAGDADDDDDDEWKQTTGSKFHFGNDLALI